LKNGILNSIKIKKVLIAAGTVALLMVILFSPLRFYLYSFNFYDKLYTDNGVYNVLEKEDVAKLTADVVDFFRYDKPFESFELKSQIDYFDKDEISHLNDVRILLKKILLIFYISIAVLAICIIMLSEKRYLYYFKNLSLIFLLASGIMIFLLIVLYILGNNFSSLFERFHYVFFPQGNWAFNENALIITIFPFGFFSEFFFKLLISSFVIASILLICSITAIIFINFYAGKKIGRK
jgi:integral membrane protein (TIGR01906 family)